MRIFLFLILLSVFLAQEIVFLISSIVSLLEYLKHSCFFKLIRF